MTIGERIKNLRTERGWSQMYLGLEVGLCQTTIYEYENQFHSPPWKNILKLSRAFEMKPEEFLKGVYE